MRWIPQLYHGAMESPRAEQLFEHLPQPLQPHDDVVALIRSGALKTQLALYREEGQRIRGKMMGADLKSGLSRASLATMLETSVLRDGTVLRIANLFDNLSGVIEHVLTMVEGGTERDVFDVTTVVDASLNALLAAFNPRFGNSDVQSQNLVRWKEGLRVYVESVLRNIERLK